MRLRHSFGLALGLAICATPVEAQLYGDGYLFHAPNARVTVRGGYALATAGSDLFDFATEQLTLNKRDFSGFTGAIELSVPVSQRIDLSVDLAYSGKATKSEFRHFIDNNDLPIEQTTNFERVPLMLNVRYYLAPPGRSIGTLAWIPSSLTPYVGAGAGSMWYKFRQKGDFVDFQTSRVYGSSYESSAWAPAVQAMGGAEISVTPLLAITTDARYVWARGTLGRDFSGFDRIDLSGVSATVGLTFRL